MQEVYDLVIIGAGPAGMAAAIYANRAMLNFVILERGFPGGQIVETHEVDNYPGIIDISGIDLSMRLLEHAQHLGVEVRTAEVSGLELAGEVKQVKTSEGDLLARTVILATGAHANHLDVPGESRFYGQGVSYCAVCDGAFYKGRSVAVIGGGDAAAKDAIYLARICSKVYVVHRRHEFRANKSLQTKLFSLANIEIVWDSTLARISGDEAVRSITVANKDSGKTKDIPVAGVFIAVGILPNSNCVAGQVEMDDRGWIITDEECETSVKGVYAAGDIRHKSLKQVVTSVADGAIAASACQKYL